MTLNLEWRDLICTTTDGKGNDKISEKPAECKIALRESERDSNRRIAGEQNAGCFDVSEASILTILTILGSHKWHNSHLLRFVMS